MRRGRSRWGVGGRVRCGLCSFAAGRGGREQSCPHCCKMFPVGRCDVVKADRRWGIPPCRRSTSCPAAPSCALLGLGPAFHSGSPSTLSRGLLPLAHGGTEPSRPFVQKGGLFFRSTCVQFTAHPVPDRAQLLQDGSGFTWITLHGSSVRLVCGSRSGASQGACSRNCSLGSEARSRCA